MKNGAQIKKMNQGMVIRVLTCALGLSLALPTQLLAASETEPAQAPLVALKTMAAPNIVAHFDTSGSMNGIFVPDTYDGVPVVSPNYSSWYDYRYSILHPGDSGLTFQQSYSSSYYVISSDRNDLWGRLIRTPQFNKIYYDPTVHYEPWLNPDGTSMNDDSNPVNPAAVRVYAANPSSATISLVGKFTVNNGNTKLMGNNSLYICQAKEQSTGFIRECPYGSNMTVYPASYFIYKGQGADGDMTFKRITSKTDPRINANNYTAVIIDEIPSEGLNINTLVVGTALANNINRPDCDNSSGQAVCSKEQEYKNFATWFIYYRNRVRVGIGAMTHVFAKNFGSDYRLGWGDLNYHADNKTSNVNGTTYKYLRRGVGAYDAARRQAFFQWLYDIETGRKSNSGTPLQLAMKDVGDYFSRQDQAGPWASKPDDASDNSPQLACRRNYLIMMTDGEWNSGTAGVGNVDGAGKGLTTIIAADGKTMYTYIPTAPYKDGLGDTLADTAMYYWARDLHPNLPNALVGNEKNPAFWQHMVTHTIGFGVSGSLDPTDETLEKIKNGELQWPTSLKDGDGSKIDDLWHAAVNGRGSYLSASNVDELVKALSGIMEDIAASDQSSPQSVSASPYLEAGNRIFGSTYKTVDWYGDFVAYKMNASGGRGVAVWRASDFIPSYKDRNIWIGTGDGMLGAVGTRAIAFEGNLNQDLISKLGFVSATTESESLVNFLRGEIDATKTQYRVRASVLGDIVNSNPVYAKQGENLGYSALPSYAKQASGESSYQTFLNNKKQRKGVVFIGANDGMLHGFSTEEGDNSTPGDAGKELFAFIPYAVTSKLPQLADKNYEKNHRYYVDGPLMLTDAVIDDQWANVLIGSTGAGAKSVFALNVTDPSLYNKAALGSDESRKKVVLWELSNQLPLVSGSPMLPELGNVLEAAAVGFVKTGESQGKWVAIFGNGVHSKSGKAILYIVDLQTGALLKSIDTGANGDNGLMGVTLIKNASQVIQQVYAGDLKGNMWKFDLSSDDSDNWKVAYKSGTQPSPLFTTENGLPISAAPLVMSHPSGGNMVLFGTGKYYDEMDNFDTTIQSIYGVWDNGVVTSNLNQLIERKAVAVGDGKYKLQNNENIDWSQHKGWRMKLNFKGTDSGQRSLYTPSAIGNNVVFETMIPQVDASSGGSVVESCDVADITGITIILNAFSGKASSLSWNVNSDGVIEETNGDYIGFDSSNQGQQSIITPENLGEQNLDGTTKCTNGRVFSHVGGKDVCAQPFDTATWSLIF